MSELKEKLCSFLREASDNLDNMSKSEIMQVVEFYMKFNHSNKLYTDNDIKQFIFLGWYMKEILHEN